MDQFDFKVGNLKILNRKMGLNELIDQAGIKPKKIIEALDVERTTWYRKKNNPDQFTVGDLKKLAHVLDCTPSAVLKAILDDLRNG